MPLRPSYPIETERLRLRPLQEGDVVELLDYHSSTDVHRYLPMGPMDAEIILERILTGPWSRSTLEEEGDAIVLGVETPETGTIVGDVMLAWAKGTNQWGEIGYVFNPKHSGRGFATEAIGALLRLAFEDLGLHRVVARVDARNEPSLRLAERLRMRREAHLIESWWHHDEWADEIHFAILKSEWETAHPA